MKRKIIALATLPAMTSIIIIGCSVKPNPPELEYATYFGSSGNDGSNNWLTGFSLDGEGNIHFATSTYHTDFPVTDNAYDKSYNG